MFHFSRYLTALLLSLFLSACGVGLGIGGPAGVSIGIGGGGSHVGFGTSVQFPIGGTNNSGINVIEEEVVAFFDSNGRAQKQATKDGYYRQLLARRGGGLYLVQDFYEDSAKKRTDSMLLTQSQLQEFYAVPNDGNYTVYYPSGRVRTQTQYQNGKAIHSKTWQDRD
ncbi:hypothetical protein [Stenoxybacter acetivorans]|uniref:hypothetical protein n=1 Tax=Stenoxybacter acetivorans TaxID=422441 RepID=UPI000566A253|nr:hypothetical protein [Stenoxybacter acetivorans]